jgi:hypothetical protein
MLERALGAAKSISQFTTDHVVYGKDLAKQFDQDWRAEDILVQSERKKENDHQHERADHALKGEDVSNVPPCKQKCSECLYEKYAGGLQTRFHAVLDQEYDGTPRRGRKDQDIRQSYSPERTGHPRYQAGDERHDQHQPIWRQAYWPNV